MAGFSYKKNLDGSSQAPTNFYAIGKNSVTFTVGDCVRLNTSGNFDLATTNEQVFGVVQTVVTKNGRPVATDTGTSDTWTMAADNTTVDLYEVGVIPALPNYIWECDSDTTIEIASYGKYFALNSTSDGVVTSGESDTLGSLDMQCLGIDAYADVSKGLYRFINPQLGTRALSNRAA